MTDKSAGRPDSPINFGLILHPVSDRRLELDRLIRANFDVVDEAAQSRVTWLLFGDPRLTGENYRRTRSPELGERDRLRAERYREAVEQSGSEDHHIRGQLIEFTERLGLESLTRPFIVFRASPGVGRYALLPIPEQSLDTQHRQRQLMGILERSLTEKILMDICDNTPFSRREMDHLQKHLWGTAQAICSSAGVGHRSFLSEFRQWVAAQGTEPVDPAVDTTVRWWINKTSGELGVSVSSNGSHEGTVHFQPPGKMGTAISRNILMLVLARWPKDVTMMEVIQAGYPGRMAKLRSSSPAPTSLGKDVESACTYIQEKFRKQGVTSPVLTRLKSTNPNSPLLKLAANQVLNDDPELGSGRIDLA